MKFSYATGSEPLAGYTIRRGVGVGGFGEVYFATSTAGKEVALKRVQRNLDIELRGVSQCLNLKHPNLVDLYDIRYDDDGQAWVVMEYVAGESLRDRLDSHPTGLEDQQVAHWFGQTAAGVAYLHACGIVHRDLKPGNIFDDAGIVKIGDYGLSKFISSSRRGGQTESVGTFHYMAPEVGRGDYGKEIDIYALGVMLHEMVTGRVPFDGESSHEIVMKHLTATPELDEVPEPYRSVVAQALEKAPSARQSSVAEMLHPLGLKLDAQGLVHPLHDGEVVPRQYVARQVPDAKKKPDSPMAAGTAPHSPQPQAAFAGGGSAAAAVALQSIPADDGEPIARALRNSVNNFKDWWNELQLTPGGRVVLVALATLFLIANTNWLLPLLALFGVIYIPYYIIRLLVLTATKPATYPEAHAMAVAQAAHRPPLSYRQWRLAARHEMARKPLIHRGAELTGGYAVAAVTTTLLTSVATLVGLREGPITAIAIAPYAWAGTVGLAGALLLLSLGKLWEPQEAGTGPRRTMMLGAGALLGAFAFGLTQFLMLDTGTLFSEAWGVRPEDSLFPVLYHDGLPTLGAYMIYFALLLAGLRWWKAVDPLRNSRLSLWSAAVAGVAAWGLNLLIPIGGPWTLLAASVMAITAQSAAPWENPRDRYSREAIA